MRWTLVFTFLAVTLVAQASGDEAGPLGRDGWGNVTALSPSRAAHSNGTLPGRGLTTLADADSARASSARRDSAPVTGIAVAFHDGQTFITWRDVAAGFDGVGYRYSVYRSTKPITEATLSSAQLIAMDILNNSAGLFGTNFWPEDRLKPNKPMTVTRQGGKPLPRWSGLAVHTALKDESAFYAVAATDRELHRLSAIVPGTNATVVAVEEHTAPIQPMLLADARSRPGASVSAPVDAQKGLPLTLRLHVTEPAGGGASAAGDYYLYYGDDTMGYRDGMPGVFSVEKGGEFATALGGALGTDRLELFTRDAIISPFGDGVFETDWFGYEAVPQWAPNTPPRVYPFTENRLQWLIDWTVHRYAVDARRIYVLGELMGGWGATIFGLRHPEIFAAIYAGMPRPRVRNVPTLVPRDEKDPALMPDGTDYFQRMDTVRFVAQFRGELPFIAWTIGRHDPYASWADQVDLARALEATHRGFVFAWNDGAHADGTGPMPTLLHYYGPDKFARDKSYPALSNSSIDARPGNGDPADGDKIGGINLGFAWSDPNDTVDTWSTRISNDLAQRDMTVDVTPRRAQHFVIAAGEVVKWRTSTGSSGTATANRDGFVTIPRVVIRPHAKTMLTLARS